MASLSSTFTSLVALALPTIIRGVAALPQRGLSASPSSWTRDLLAPALSSSCSTSGTLSCHNTTRVSNLCCFESPGGLILQTQFWDFDPPTGPSNSWTIHGLWPDNCDGTFEQNCDPSRDYTNLPSILTNNGAQSTLNFMNQFWIDINGDNEQFWEHEWAKHGTCMSTLERACLPSGSPQGAEAAAYFTTAVNLFQSLPTYTWLANAGITPSTTKTFTLSQIISALRTGSGGHTPSVTCDGNSLNAISWFFNLQGSVIDGTFVPTDAITSSSCPSSGIMYPPKTSGGSTTTVSSPTPTNAPGSLPTKATIHAIRSGSTSQLGGLLSLGTWSTQTLATFTLSGSASGFTMTSSKGNCGVSGGTFSCGSGVSLTTFSAVTSGGNLLLASSGSSTWSSDGVPSGQTVFTVFNGSGHSNDYTLAIIST